MPLLLAACVGDSPASVAPVGVPEHSAVARASTPPAPPPLEADPIAGAYAAEFSVSIESSCSQSWDVTTWSGDASLQVQADGRASFELGFDSRSVGGSWQGNGDTSVYEWERRTCHWEGHAVEDAGRTRITMEQVGSGDSMCDGGFVVDPDHPPPALELVCKRGQEILPGVSPGALVVENPTPIEVELLTCTPGEQVPHMVRYLVDPEANVLRLGAGQLVRIAADEMGFAGTMYSIVVTDPQAEPQVPDAPP